MPRPVLPRRERLGKSDDLFPRIMASDSARRGRCDDDYSGQKVWVRKASRSTERPTGFMPESSSTNAIISTASFIPTASRIVGCSASSRSSKPPAC